MPRLYQLYYCIVELLLIFISYYDRNHHMRIDISCQFSNPDVSIVSKVITEKTVRIHQKMKSIVFVLYLNF